MAYYRLYFLDGGDRHIRTFRAFEADDDGAAAALAERWRGVHPMELWCGGRKVSHWCGFTSPLRRAAGTSARRSALSASPISGRERLR